MVVQFKLLSQLYTDLHRWVHLSLSSRVLWTCVFRCVPLYQHPTSDRLRRISCIEKHLIHLVYFLQQANHLSPSLILSPQDPNLFQRYAQS
jgi:hypothetical protein